MNKSPDNQAEAVRAYEIAPRPHCRCDENAHAHYVMGDGSCSCLLGRLCPTPSAEPDDEAARFYAVSDMPLGMRVYDGRRYGSIVRRAASTWVCRDSKPPKIRWDGNIDAQEVTWQELEEFTTPAPAQDGAEVEQASNEPLVRAIVEARLRHYGYETDWIRAHEDNPDHFAEGCELISGVGWMCVDDEGLSLHGDHDEYAKTVEEVMWVLESAPLSDWLAQRDKDRDAAVAVKAQRQWERAVLEHVLANAPANRADGDVTPDWIGAISTAMLAGRAAALHPSERSE